MTNSIDRRLPAEWEEYSTILLAYPHTETDWAYILDEVQQTYRQIIKAITSQGIKVILVLPDNIHLSAEISENPLVKLARIETNDTWARDFGPITVIQDDKPTLLDFMFNGWGLKFPADRDNLITSRLHRSGGISGTYENHLGFVLEGGSIESDGLGTILTTSECLLSPNRNGGLTQQQIEQHLCQASGAQRVLWLNHGYLAGDDTDSHIDTLARLVAPDAIAYVAPPIPGDEHFNALTAMEQELKTFRTNDGRPYRLYPLPLPDPIYDNDGARLPATYANFLIMPHAVILPVYNQPQNDAQAISVMQQIYPQRTIIPIDANSLIKQHGSIHCITMQLQ